MSTFSLEIITPEKIILNKEVQHLIVRTTEGDVGILKNHVDYVAAIKKGPLKIFVDGKYDQKAMVKDGLISVLNGKVTIIVMEYLPFFERN